MRAEKNAEIDKPRAGNNNLKTGGGGAVKKDDIPDLIADATLNDNTGQMRRLWRMRHMWSQRRGSNKSNQRPRLNRFWRN